MTTALITIRRVGSEESVSASKPGCCWRRSCKTTLSRKWSIKNATPDGVSTVPVQLIIAHQCRRTTILKRAGCGTEGVVANCQLTAERRRLQNAAHCWLRIWLPHSRGSVELAGLLNPSSFGNAATTATTTTLEANIVIQVVYIHLSLYIKWYYVGRLIVRLAPIPWSIYQFI